MNETKDDKKLSNLKTSAEYKNYLKFKAINHSNYKLYDKEDRLKCVFEDKILYLSNGEKWNDTEDRDAFYRKDIVQNFARCFTFSRSENVAMWMLYGGVKNKGIMIDFKKSDIKDIITNCKQVTLGKWDDNSPRFIPARTVERKDFELYLVDILYYGDNKDKTKYDLKRSNDSSYDIEKSLIDSLGFFKKHYPWSYENECRLILSLNTPIEGNDITTAKIEFGDIIKKDLKDGVIASPNYTGENSYKPSKLSGKMSWNFCEDCKK